jgi:hypothetical protein
MILNFGFYKNFTNNSPDKIQFNEIDWGRQIQRHFKIK